MPKYKTTINYNLKTDSPTASWRVFIYETSAIGAMDAQGLAFIQMRKEGLDFDVIRDDYEIDTSIGRGVEGGSLQTRK